MKKNKKNKIVRILIVVALFLTISVSIRNHINGSKNGTIGSNGRINGREIALATKFAGRLQKLYVEEGDEVKKGQLIAEIDDRALRADLASLEAKAEQLASEIKIVEAEIISIKSDIDFARKDFDRNKKLIKNDYVSKLDYDSKLNTLQKAKASLKASEARKMSFENSHKAMLSEIESMKIDLEDMKIYAPSDGVMLYQLTEEGEILSGGSRLFIMINMDKLYMTVYVPSADAGRVKLGDKAIIELDAYLERKFDAKVTFISDVSEFTPKEIETKEERLKLVFRMKLSLKDNKERLVKSGMPGRGYIISK